MVGVLLVSLKNRTNKRFAPTPSPNNAPTVAPFQHFPPLCCPGVPGLQDGCDAAVVVKDAARHLVPNQLPGIPGALWLVGWLVETWGNLDKVRQKGAQISLNASD